MTIFIQRREHIFAVFWSNFGGIRGLGHGPIADQVFEILFEGLRRMTGMCGTWGKHAVRKKVRVPRHIRLPSVFAARSFCVGIATAGLLSALSVVGHSSARAADVQLAQNQPAQQQAPEGQGGLRKQGNVFEWLVATMPPEYRLAGKNLSVEADFYAYTPGGVRGEQASEIVTVQVLRNLGSTTINDYAERLKAGYEQVCGDQLEALRRQPTLENALPTVGIAISCGKRSTDGRGVFAALKLIQAQTAFFVIQRLYQGAPFPVATPPVDQATLDSWASYLRLTVLCRAGLPRNQDHAKIMLASCLPGSVTTSDVVEVIPALAQRAAAQ